jgi:uncharacterized pyridoxamine 5'-phosphate oxidase family protein
MKTDFLYNFISRHRFAVLSTISLAGTPESALIGFAAAPDLRLIFDTVSTSRKYRNLLQNRSVSLVIGWDDEQTVQYEGRVIFQSGKEFNKMLDLYYSVFPNGKDRKKNWKDIVYFVVVPEWIRYSDFNVPTTIDETDFLVHKLKPTL